jgi:hypothetical protein
MKKYPYCIIAFILMSSLCKAQARIEVLIDNEKITLPNGIESSNIALPVSLVFDEKKFKNKTITFFSIKNNSKNYLDAKFGSGDLVKKQLNNRSVFEIEIKDDKTINIKQGTKKIPGDKLIFKIDQSSFSPELMIDNSSNDRAIQKKPVGNQGDDLHTGFIIDDVLLLKQMKDKHYAASDEIRKILRRYEINDDDQLKKNHFLNSVLVSVFDSIDLNNIQAGNAGASVSSLFSSIGGLDVTNIADGLAKFIVKRAKQELSIAFFQKFKDDIEKHQDLKTLFPQTWEILRTIDQEIYNYSNYIKSLREAFRTDLNNIDEYLPNVVDSHAVFESSPYFELGLALKTGCYISSSLKHDMHPGDNLDAYPLSLFNNPPPADVAKLNILKGAIQSLQLLSESLREGDTSKHSYWVRMDKIRQVVSDKGAFKIYLGLLLQVAHIKYENITFDSTIDFYSLLNKPENVQKFDNSTEIYGAYKNYILNFGSKVNEISKMIKEFDKAASDSIKVEQYASYFNAAAGLVKYCLEVSTLPVLRDNEILKNLKSNSKKYFEIAGEATQLVIAINRKNYSEIANHVIVIYTKIAVESAIAPNTSQVVVLMAEYASFMANMINAKSSAEVASVIEDAALPVGSSSIKRKTPFNVSLNAYAGFFVGHEYIKKIDDKHVVNSYGVTAPIGVAMSWGKKCGWSSSLFISLIDLGAVAAFRVNNDSIASVPTIQLKDIFSPGAFLSIGVPKSPISFNLGAQFGPNLRKVEASKNDYSNKTYVRVSASICVDIPLLNFYTSPKK